VDWERNGIVQAVTLGDQPVARGQIGIKNPALNAPRRIGGRVIPVPVFSQHAEPGPEEGFMLPSPSVESQCDYCLPLRMLRRQQKRV
jgi:hypothetical protein